MSRIRRAGARGRKWAPPCPHGPLLRGRPIPAIVCAPGPPGVLRLGVPVSVGPSALFAHLPPARWRAPARRAVSGPSGLRASAARRARPPLRGPAPAHSARGRGRASLAVPPAGPGLCPRPCAPFVPPWAFGGPPGGVRAGGVFPPALFVSLLVSLVRRSGGPSAGPLARLRARGAPGPAPRRGLWAALFFAGGGPFCFAVSS